MKKTSLNETHHALGAKMVEFAGYEMPVSYTGIRHEHEVVRTKVGMFDVSHMGEFIVRGKQAFDLVQHVTSNDVSKLEMCDAQYSCLPNNTGGIVDDLLVYRLTEDMCSDGEQAYMLVVNASNMKKDWDWIESHNHFDTQMIDISDQTCLLAVQGPLAAQALQILTPIDLNAMKYYTFEKGQFAGIENVIVSATGYTGSGGFEIYVNAKDAKVVWDAIMTAGADHGIEPIGLGARDTLRLEMGFALYGNDIDDTTSPLEAGLNWITKLQKGPFVGSDWLTKQKEAGTSRRLTAFEMIDKGIPRKGYAVVNEAGEHIGTVTSGTQSPSMGKAIGMAYINKPMNKIGNEIFIDIRNRKIKAETVKLPFYKA